MPETLMAEDRQRCGDAVQNTLDVDVDHLLPIRDAQVVEGGNRPNSGIIDENVKSSLPYRSHASLTRRVKSSRRFTFVGA